MKFSGTYCLVALVGLGGQPTAVSAEVQPSGDAIYTNAGAARSPIAEVLVDWNEGGPAVTRVV